VVSVELPSLAALDRSRAGPEQAIAKIGQMIAPERGGLTGT